MAQRAQTTLAEVREKARPREPTLVEVVAATAGRRLSRPACNGPCTTHHQRGKRLKRLRGFVGYKLWRWQSLCTSARQSCFAGRRQKSSYAEEPWSGSCATTSRGSQPHTKSRYSDFTGALCGLSQGARFGAGQQRSFEECESYFHFPPRGDGSRASGSSHSDASVRCSLQGEFWRVVSQADLSSKHLGS